MDILLVDVDSKEGNLALAKYSTHYKKERHNVVCKRLGLDGYPSKKHIIVDAVGFDKVFASNLFEVNQDKFEIINCNDVVIGGMGSVNPELNLSPEIYNEDADESLFFDDIDREYITRGCVRKCYFCKVWRYEGTIRFNKPVSEIVKRHKVKFMDNNILSYPGHLEIFADLVERQIRLQFNQGLDIRFINDINAKLLSKMNYMGEYIFAFDNIKDEKMISRGLDIFKQYMKKDWKCKFYIYHNEEFDSIADLIYRVEWCRANRALPYVMRDKNCWGSKNKDFLTDLAAYCNQPSLFKKMSFETFLNKRHTDRHRIEKSLEVYYSNLKMERAV